VGEAVLGGKSALKPSENDYDWLGPGIYFWVDSQDRGLQWAKEHAALGTEEVGTKVNDPFVIGAFIYPGLCLNLTDYGVASELLSAHATLSQSLGRTITELPKNTIRDADSGTYLKRNLDCAVVKTVHTLREGSEIEPYQTVYGVFEEGEPLYKNAGFRKKTHVQIAVIDPECILGYFRVLGI
jgi:hypothetical protein